MPYVIEGEITLQNVIDGELGIYLPVPVPIEENEENNEESQDG